MPDSLSHITARLKDWMITAALPFWADMARDDRGGFYEDLDMNAVPRADVIRRVRVQARQVHVYALAHKLGWYDGLDIAHETFAFMNAVGFMPDGKPGFVHLIHSDYSVHDATRDLYDHAFFRLACSSLLAVDNNESVQATLRAIDAVMNTAQHPSGGWMESLSQTDSPTLPRRQNPHMHHFEAAMALLEITKSEADRNAAAALFTLFEKYFFDPDAHIVREFFTEDWAYWPGEKGQSVEPGHGAEWIWLLGQYERLSGQPTYEYREALYSHMRDTEGFLDDEQDVSGNIRRNTRRLWVQTEAVKAHLTQYEHGDQQARDRAAHWLNAIETHYLQERGTWIDQLDADGNTVSNTIPTSTFYHIIGMIVEADRVCQL